jgi:hypothetical protein
VIVDPATVEPFWYSSTEPRPNRVLLFCTAAPLDGASLPPLVKNHETLERGVVFGPDGLDAAFAFPLHVRAAKKWMAARSMVGPADFTSV